MRRGIKAKVTEIYNTAADMVQQRDKLTDWEMLQRVMDLCEKCKKLQDQLAVDEIVNRLEQIKKVGVVNARHDGDVIDKAIRIILEKRI